MNAEGNIVFLLPPLVRMYWALKFAVPALLPPALQEHKLNSIAAHSKVANNLFILNTPFLRDDIQFYQNRDRNAIAWKKVYNCVAEMIQMDGQEYLSHAKA